MRRHKLAAAAEDANPASIFPHIGKNIEILREYAYMGKFEQLLESEWRPDVAGFRANEVDMTRSNSKTLEPAEHEHRKAPRALVSTDFSPMNPFSVLDGYAGVEKKAHSQL